MLKKPIFICLLFISCSSSRMIETSLYFAQSRPNGTLVTAAEWNRFKETHILRICEEGSTTTSVTGTWYDPDARKIITEPTYVVTYFHKKSPLISKQIDSLKNLYKTQFEQQSVLRVDKRSRVHF